MGVWGLCVGVYGLCVWVGVGVATGKPLGLGRKSSSSDCTCGKVKE